ncbi:class I SAM-dependent methyltransferase [Legionella cherrii]|uniref:Acyl-CoA N-acyltransferase n=1 Tax=Legionella cherrii TaxID=28084 RepID=A0ABY6T376_9GAMM|nr:class I SAM-dependent methyltransferase [Legionella cherrii]VEB33965.1 acyl-CoA N-acyltransferase [Legionella cherrii]
MPNKSLDTYLSLCTQVYDLSKPLPPKDAWDFYLSYAQEADGPILEPMCGTGRFLLPMLGEGFDVEGFDASQSMLDALHAKARAQHLNPNIWHGYLEKLQQAKQYSLIFIPSGSFGLIIDLAAVKHALNVMYDHLKENGRLIFETETLNAVPKELGIWRGSRWHRADGQIILLSQLAMLQESICYSIGKYELVEANQLIKTEIEEYKIRLYDDPSLLVDLLHETGFKEIRLLKAFDRSASPDKNDETVIYECRK